MSFYAEHPQPEQRSSPEPLNIRLTAGDAEMVVSWAEEALTKLCDGNPVLRESIRRFRKAFNDAARDRLMGGGR